MRMTAFTNCEYFRIRFQLVYTTLCGNQAAFLQTEITGNGQMQVDQLLHHTLQVMDNNRNENKISKLHGTETLILN